MASVYSAKTSQKLFARISFARAANRLLTSVIAIGAATSLCGSSFCWAEADTATEPQETEANTSASNSGDAAPKGASQLKSAQAKFYQVKATSIEGDKGDLSQYEGKVVLVANTASKCGFTLQYTDLQKLYERYKDKGLVVLGFPSNDFANQEPGSNKKIQEFCRVKFGVSFPMYERGHVRGAEKQPLFKLLTEESGKEFQGEVEWNFEKFLIDRKGTLRARFGSFSNPQSQTVIEKVEALLAE